MINALTQIPTIKDNKLRTVYYTDDDLDDLDFFKDACSGLDIDVNLFANSNDLFFALNNSENLPVIIFLDLNIPGKSGYEIIKELKLSNRFSNLPIVILSTSDNASCIEISRDSGAHFYIVKPNSLSELTDAIKHTLAIDWKNFTPEAKNFVYRS